MARTIPQHKASYFGFIDPNYAKVNQVNGWEIAKKFEAFSQTCLDEIPDEGAPADGYRRNAHTKNGEYKIFIYCPCFRFI
jgi:hypothetical protein